MRCLLIGSMFTICSIQSFAQGVSSSAFKEFPHYKIYQGIFDEGNFPITGARLCTTEGKSRCFALAPSRISADRDTWIQYGLRAWSRRLELNGIESMVLFNANSGGGSGSSESYVLLRSEPKGNFKDLLPEVIVSNQADVATWDVPTASTFPVLLTADFLWGANEAHYSSRFFEIRMYVYDQASDKYKLRHKYRTSPRYPGIDNWEQAPEVLEKEREKITKIFESE